MKIVFDFQWQSHVEQVITGAVDELGVSHIQYEYQIVDGFSFIGYYRISFKLQVLESALGYGNQ